MTAIEVGGRQVFIRTPTVKQFRELQEQYGDSPEGEAGLVALCLVDEAGAQVFTKEQVDDWPLPDYLRVLPPVRRATFGDGDKDAAKKG